MTKKITLKEARSIIAKENSKKAHQSMTPEARKERSKTALKARWGKK